MRAISNFAALLILSIAVLAISNAHAVDNEPSSHHSFGDSITAGMGVAPDYRYANLLAQSLNLNLRNFAVSGQTACQMSDSQIFANSFTRETPAISTVMIGTNDSNVEGVGKYEAVYQRCLKASLTWLSIATEDKTFPSSASCVREGKWEEVPQAKGAIQSKQFGARLNCTFDSDLSPVYFWYANGDDLNGSFTFTIDGQQSVQVRTLSVTPIKMRDGRGLRGQVGFRYSGLKPGRHTISFVVNSKNQSPVILYAVGSLTNQHVAPKVLVGGVPFQLANLKGAASARYNAIAQSVASNLRAEGFSVKFVDVRSKHRGTPSEMQDNLHPNNLGNLHLHKAFFDATLPNLSPIVR